MKKPRVANAPRGVSFPIGQQPPVLPFQVPWSPGVLVSQVPVIVVPASVPVALPTSVAFGCQVIVIALPETVPFN